MFYMDLIQLSMDNNTNSKSTQNVKNQCWAFPSSSYPQLALIFVFSIIINIIWLRLIFFSKSSLWVKDVSTRSIFERWFQEELEGKSGREIVKGRKPVKDVFWSTLLWWPVKAQFFWRYLTEWRMYLSFSTTKS